MCSAWGVCAWLDFTGVLFCFSLTAFLLSFLLFFFKFTMLQPSDLRKHRRKVNYKPTALPHSPLEPNVFSFSFSHSSAVMYSGPLLVFVSDFFLSLSSLRWGNHGMVILSHGISLRQQMVNVGF